MDRELDDFRRYIGLEDEGIADDADDVGFSPTIADVAIILAGGDASGVETTERFIRKSSAIVVKKLMLVRAQRMKIPNLPGMSDIPDEVRRELYG